MTVVIVYGDPVVGQSLAVSLRSESYDARLVASSSLEDPEERSRLFREARLLLLAPGLSARRRDRALNLLRGPDAAGVTVVELGEPPDEARVGAPRSAPWPARTEDLRRWVRSALPDAGAPADDRRTPGG